MLRHGGHAIALEVGSGSWNLETESGATMNGNKPEHVREAVPVISRLADMIGVRSFSSGYPLTRMITILSFTLSSHSAVSLSSAWKVLANILVRD